MDQFIYAINDVHKYYGLCGVLRARMEDILGVLSWEALKQVARKDNIDRSSDKNDKDQKRTNKRDTYRDRSGKDEYRKSLYERFKLKSGRLLIPKFKRRFQPKD